MSEVNNIDVAALAAQVAEGTAEIVEAKPAKKGLSTGNKVADAGIVLGLMTATGVAAFFAGEHHERKKWQNFEEDDDFDEDEDFYLDDSEEPEDQEKPEKVDGQVEEK